MNGDARRIERNNLRSYHDTEAMGNHVSGKELIIGIAYLPDKRSTILRERTRVSER